MRAVLSLDSGSQLQVAVRNRDQLLRDTVIWDILQPFNTAQQYASDLCEGLGLRFDWYKSIVDVMEELLNDILSVRRLSQRNTT